MWIVNLDRETGCGSALTTEATVVAKELEEMEDIDAVQDQLNDLGFLGSTSQDGSDDDPEANLDEDISVSYDTDDSSLYDSSSKTSSDPNSDIIPKQPEQAPATAAQVIKAR